MIAVKFKSQIAPWRFRSLAISFPGTFAPWLFRCGHRRRKVCGNGGAKSGGLGDSRGAEGAEVERHRIEAPKAPLVPREVGVGRRLRRGCAPPQKFFFDF